MLWFNILFVQNYTTDILYHSDFFLRDGPFPSAESAQSATFTKTAASFSGSFPHRSISAQSIRVVALRPSLIAPVSEVRLHNKATSFRNSVQLSAALESVAESLHPFTS